LVSTQLETRIFNTAALPKGREERGRPKRAAACLGGQIAAGRTMMAMGRLCGVADYLGTCMDPFIYVV
jgi:hypothetical protein